MTRKFWADMAERVVWTFIQGFFAVWIVTGNLDKDTLIGACVAGGISAGKCIIAANIGNRDSASSVPSV